MQTVYAVMNVLLPFEALRFEFMKNAFLAVLLLTPLLGLLGTMAVNRSMAFFSDALGHSALTGLGLGVMLGIASDTVSLLIFGILWALLLFWIRKRGMSSTDTIISVFSSTFIALGMILLSTTGNSKKLSSLLLGDILAVTQTDLLWLLLSLIAGVAIWALMYNGLLLTSVNPTLSMSRGVKHELYECAFMVLVAVAVMLSIRWVGVLLINALLILPAAAARNLAKNSRMHAALSVSIALVCGIGGLLLAYWLDTSAGATIVLLAAGVFTVSLLISPMVRR